MVSTSTKYTIRFIGDRIRSNQNELWVVEVCNTNHGNTSFFYFETAADAIAKYPQVAYQYHGIWQS